MASTTGSSSDTTANQDSGRSRAFAAGRPPKQVAAEKSSPEPGRSAAPAKTRVAGLHRPAERPSASFRRPDPKTDSAGAADELVRLLVEQLSPLLGLDAARVSIGVTMDAGAPRGAASDHRIEFSGDAHSRHAKTVVAHE